LRRAFIAGGYETQLNHTRFGSLQNFHAFLRTRFAAESKICFCGSVGLSSPLLDQASKLV